MVAEDLSAAMAASAFALEKRMSLKTRINLFFSKIRTLQGDPHYIALGLALGVFTGVTPTVPFQTVIAVTLAFILKASKPAAVIGTLTANPVTLPLYYMGSFSIGNLLLGNSIPSDIPYGSVAELLKLGTDVTLAMLTGGVLMGLVPGIATYLIARKFFRTIRARLDASKLDKKAGLGEGGPNKSKLLDKRMTP